MKKIIVLIGLFLAFLIPELKAQFPKPTSETIKPIYSPVWLYDPADSLLYMGKGSTYLYSTILTDPSKWVPYKGAIHNLDLNTHFISTSGVKFNTTNPLVVSNPGDVAWNAHDRTINIKTPNTTIQVSQEQTFPVKNANGYTLLDGHLVRITGYDVINDYYYVDYSDNSTEATSYVDFMLSESIAVGSVGLATKVGLVHGVNTTGGTSQNPVYLSTTGQYSPTEPAYPGKAVVIGTYGHIDAVNGDIFVDLNKSSQYEINKINNSLELKGMQNPGICQKCPITENDIVVNTTDLTVTIATIKNGETISAANPIRFFTDGQGVITKWEKTSPVTFTFTNTSGIWYFYFDSSGNPIATQVPWSDFNVIAAVYRLYWNATLSGVARDVIEAAEYHINDISASDHMWKHNEGTKHLSGADYSANVLATGVPNADGRNAVISLSNSTLVDDNLVYTVTNTSTGVVKFTQDLGVTTAGSLNATNSGQFMVRINDSGGLLNKLPATRFPFAWSATTNRPQYITSTGVRTEVTNQYFFVYFMYALQDPRRGEALKVVSALTEYETAALAATSSWEALQAVYPTLRDNEIRLLYKMTFECRHSVPNPYDVGTKFAVLRQIDDLRKLKITSTSIASGTVLASNVIVTPSGNISSLDAQSAFIELDNEKEPTLTKGNLTESVTGLQFDNTRQVIGGAADLSVSSGYVIPTTTNIDHAETAYTHSQNDADISVTNEGSLTATDKTTYSKNIHSNTSGSTDVVMRVDSIVPALLISRLNNKITLKADTTVLMKKSTVASMYQPKGNYAPASGSANYIWNGTSQQTGSYNLTGNGVLGGTIQATTAKLTNLTDGFLPYHISDASGFGNTDLFYNGTNYGLGYSTGTEIDNNKLAVNGSAYFNGYLTQTGDFGFSGTSGNHYIYFPDTGTHTGTMHIQAGYGSGGAGGSISLYGEGNSINYGGVNIGLTDSRASFTIKNSGIGVGEDILTLKQTGNLGIGYSTGTEISNNKLAVNGSIFANGNIYSGGSIRATQSGESFRVYEPSSTSPYSIAFANSGNAVYFGIEGGTAGGYFNNSNAYEAVIYGANSLMITAPIRVLSTVNSTGYLLNGNNLFSSLSSNYLPYWDGTKFVDLYNPTVQTLSGTTPTYNASNGVDATITISGNTSFSMQNLTDGMAGTIYITNPSTVYKVKFLGYNLKIAANLTYDSNGITLKGLTTPQSLGWKYIGGVLLIHGTYYNSITF